MSSELELRAAVLAVRQSAARHTTHLAAVLPSLALVFQMYDTNTSANTAWPSIL